ncbi:molybdopterin-guanine dinucleotide biosynthesis protein B [Thermodesulfobacteriota bacterium]
MRGTTNQKIEHRLSPVVTLVGKSGTGKTTFLEKLLPALKERGLRIGTIKHDVHGFELDHPGKDSWRHKQAGADTTVISSPKQIGMVRDVDHDHTVSELIPIFSNMDLVIVEGFKKEKNPKVEIFRSEVSREPLCSSDENLIALVSDKNLDLGVPRFDLEDVQGLADFLIDFFKLRRSVL